MFLLQWHTILAMYSWWNCGRSLVLSDLTNIPRLISLHYVPTTLQTSEILRHLNLENRGLNKNKVHIQENVFKCRPTFFNRNNNSLIKNSLNFVPGGQVIISQHWFRKWLEAKQATHHYQTKHDLIYCCIYVDLCVRFQWVNSSTPTGTYRRK